MRNQKGSTLIEVLLVILIFSVLGISLLANVVGENKSVNITESNVQTRNLARDGLTFFETTFKDYINKNKPITLKELKSFFSDANYPDQGWVTIRSTESEKVEIMVSHPDIIKTAQSGFQYSDELVERNYITVHSKGDDGTTKTELNGLFYAENGIELHIPKGQTMIINGEVLGDITIIGGGTLIIHPNSYQNVEFKDIKLIARGREFEERK